MFKFIACLLTSIFVSSTAVADEPEERLFVYLERDRDKNQTLTVSCHFGPGTPMSRNDAIEFAKNHGFQTGNCSGTAEEMVLIRVSPLYLMPIQIESLQKIANERGVGPYLVSDVWPPKN